MIGNDLNDQVRRNFPLGIWGDREGFLAYCQT